MKNARARRKPSKLPMIFYLTAFSFLVMTLSAGLLYGSWVLNIRTELVRFQELTLDRLLLWALIISVVISTGIVSVLGNHFVFKSVRELSDASRRVAAGDFSLHLDIPKEKEMGELVISFNDMVEQLDKQALLSKGFASGVSHEFKTPLSAIRGYAQLLGEEASPQKRAYYSEIIVQKTDALTNLVNKMLELFRLENQGAEIPQTVFSLDEQIRKTIIFLEPVWYAKRIEMIPVLTPVSYCGAKEFIGQIWQNLIENAVKFTPSGGKITVSLEKRGDDVLVRVADSGIGMDEETRAHMFDAFYQGSPAQSSDGVGLGLALTKRILALAHGSIRVKSAPNHGTTIEVLLPAKGVEEEP